MARETKRRRVLGIEPDRLVEIGDGPVEVLVGHPDDAAIAIGVGLAGREADDVAEIGDRLVEVLAGRPGRAADSAGKREAGIEPDRLLAIGHRVLGVFALQEQDHGPHGVVVRIARRSADCIAEIFDGLLDGHDLPGIGPADRPAVGRQAERIAVHLIDAVDGHFGRALGRTCRRCGV